MIAWAPRAALRSSCLCALIEASAAGSLALRNAIGKRMERTLKRQGAHYLAEDFVGEACPLLIYGDNGDEPEVCGAAVGPRRRGTGVRSLWHYCGLHVVDGRLPKQRKGQQGTWRPSARGALLIPDVGIAGRRAR